MTEETTTPTQEQIKVDIKDAMEELVEIQAAIVVHQAKLDKKLALQQEILERTALYQQIQYLQEFIDALKEDAHGHETTAAGLARYLYEETANKHPHDLISISERTNVEIADEDGLYAYATEHAPNLMVTKPANMSSFKKWVKAQLEADSTLARFASTVVSASPTFSRKAIAELVEARTNELQKQEDFLQDMLLEALRDRIAKEESQN